MSNYYIQPYINSYSPSPVFVDQFNNRWIYNPKTNTLNPATVGTIVTVLIRYNKLYKSL